MEEVCGHIKHVLTRYGTQTHEGMVVIIAYRANVPHLRDIVDTLIREFNDIRTVILNVNKRHDNVILGDEEIILYGDGIISDSLLNRDYTISMKSFYQINPRQVEVLYSKAIDMAHLTEDDIVLDAYCGIGTIALSLANQIKKVYGVEIVQDAINNAKDNAKRNHITNAEFVCDDAGDYMVKCVEKQIPIDVVIVDPPRKGCSELFINQLKLLHPERIVYISCNVSTQARDIALLKDLYVVNSVQPVDMFPQTISIETCVLLVREFADDDEVVSIKVDLDGISLNQGEYIPPAKPTYKNIKQWIEEKYGFKVSTLYIAQIKDKAGLKKRKNYNPGTGEGKVPVCPPEKEEAIMDAFRHFNLI